MRFCCSPLCVACVFVLGYTCVYLRLLSCVSTSQCLSINLHACACVYAVCVFVGICLSVPWVCVCCSIQLETSNPTFLFHCLNERVKRLLVVITVIHFFSFVQPMKSALTSSTIPSAAGCGLFCKEIPLFMFKWVLHYVLLFNHWSFYALRFPWVYRCAWVCLCRII